MKGQRRVMLAAPKSGSGKTILTCALLQAFKEQGYSMVSFKCGPDYIDPMFHKSVLEIPSKNLDTFFTDEETTRNLFCDGCRGADMTVIEGVMGLYDGLGGVREEGSSYHLAEVTRTPIILVVDVRGMGKSVVALIKGFLAYDTGHWIRGVLLNRMSGGYYETLKPVLEQECGIPVVGYVPENKSMHLESRHLGLWMPEEVQNIQKQLRIVSEVFQKTVSLEQIMAIAETAETLELTTDDKLAADTVDPVPETPVIAVARDEAFCFYYEDNLRLLERFGAKLRYFSPIHDKRLPEEVNGILLGGGYPEIYAEPLSANKTMLESIRNAVQGGMPVVAECGGFLYLHKWLKDDKGIFYEMAGVLQESCQNTGKLVRFGYIRLTEKKGCFLPEGTNIAAHEFHYYDSSQNGEGCIAKKPVTGKTYPCVIAGEHYWLGFPHLYYPSNPEFARRFVEMTARFSICSNEKILL